MLWESVSQIVTAPKSTRCLPFSKGFSTGKAPVVEINTHWQLTLILITKSGANVKFQAIDVLDPSSYEVRTISLGH